MLGMLLQLLLKSLKQHLYVYKSARETELYTTTLACALAKGKTTDIYANSWHAFGVSHDFGMLWKQ